MGKGKKEGNVNYSVSQSSKWRVFSGDATFRFYPVVLLFSFAVAAICSQLDVSSYLAHLWFRPCERTPFGGCFLSALKNAGLAPFSGSAFGGESRTVLGSSW